MDYKAYEILAKLAVQNQLDMNKEDDVKKLLAVYQSRVTQMGQSPIFVYGKRLQNAFFEMTKALNHVQLIKEEDSPSYHSKMDLKIPDYRIVAKDGEEFLVEVKNYSPKAKITSKKHTKYDMKREYWKRLKTYADIVSTPLKVAIFWRLWDHWTLSEVDDFKDAGLQKRITFSQAFKYNQMSKLGDKKIATKSPLVFRLIMEPRAIEDKAPVKTIHGKIIDVQLCSDQNVIEDKEMSNLAYLLFWFGMWKQRGPIPIIEDNILHGVEYVAEPLEPVEGQESQVVAPLSTMYMNMYHLQTYRKKGLPDVYPKEELPPISRIIPENPFHRGLPLWIFIQQPA